MLYSTTRLSRSIVARASRLCVKGLTTWKAVSKIPKTMDVSRYDGGFADTNTSHMWWEDVPIIDLSRHLCLLLSCTVTARSVFVFVHHKCL